MEDFKFVKFFLLFEWWYISQNVFCYYTFMMFICCLPIPVSAVMEGVAFHCRFFPALCAMLPYGLDWMLQITSQPVNQAICILLFSQLYLLSCFNKNYYYYCKVQSHYSVRFPVSFTRRYFCGPQQQRAVPRFLSHYFAAAGLKIYS